MVFYGNYKVTSPFGNRLLNGAWDNHKGIDLVGVSDKQIHTVCGGVVGASTMLDRATDTTRTWEWGNYVRIDGDDGYKYYYCHMSKRLVNAGQRVKAGDIIGIEGNTGYSFGSHCHFEVRDAFGKSVNPAPFLGINNAIGTYSYNPKKVDYAALVCKRCGFEPQTKAYLDRYKYADDLWRKLWEAMS